RGTGDLDRNAAPTSSLAMTTATLADWTTPRPESDLDLLVVERTPHLEGHAKQCSWWRHFEPLKAARLEVDLIVSGSADAARLAGSRWHVISEAARHGRVVVVQP
ncbi:MAG: hypothetical protein ACKOPS_04675, partial [Cyanobium sp.]